MPVAYSHEQRALFLDGFAVAVLAHGRRLMVGSLDALGIEIAPHLAEHIFITRLGQVGLDHLDGISLCLVAAGVISARLALEAALGGDNR
jgi:hypothetical protein